MGGAPPGRPAHMGGVLGEMTEHIPDFSLFRETADCPSEGGVLQVFNMHL